MLSTTIELTSSVFQHDGILFINHLSPSVSNTLSLEAIPGIIQPKVIKANIITIRNYHFRSSFNQELLQHCKPQTMTFLSNWTNKTYKAAAFLTIIKESLRPLLIKSWQTTHRTNAQPIPRSGWIIAILRLRFFKLLPIQTNFQLAVRQNRCFTRYFQQKLII